MVEGWDGLVSGRFMVWRVVRTFPADAVFGHMRHFVRHDYSILVVLSLCNVVRARRWIQCKESVGQDLL